MARPIVLSVTEDEAILLLSTMVTTLTTMRRQRGDRVRREPLYQQLEELAFNLSAQTGLPMR